MHLMETFLNPPTYAESRAQINKNYFDKYHELSEFKGKFFADDMKKAAKNFDIEERISSGFESFILLIMLVLFSGIFFNFYRSQGMESSKKVKNRKMWFAFELFTLKLFNWKISRSDDDDQKAIFLRKFLRLLGELARRDLEHVMDQKLDDAQSTEDFLKIFAHKKFQLSDNTQQEIKSAIWNFHKILKIQTRACPFNEGRRLSCDVSKL